MSREFLKKVCINFTKLSKQHCVSSDFLSALFFLSAQRKSGEACFVCHSFQSRHAVLRMCEVGPVRERHKHRERGRERRRQTVLHIYINISKYISVKISNANDIKASS